MRPALSTIALALLLAGCTRHTTARRPVMMVPMPPPSEPAHAQATVAVGGAETFDADNVVACEADPPGLVRAYSTPVSLTVVGMTAGKTTLKLRLAAGDTFYLDLDVTNDAPPSYRALAIGEQLAIPLEGVRDVGVTDKCIRTTKSSDETQLFVVAERPCATIVPLMMTDGSTKTIEVIVVGGQRLL